MRGPSQNMQTGPDRLCSYMTILFLGKAGHNCIYNAFLMNSRPVRISPIQNKCDFIMLVLFRFHQGTA